MKVELLTQLVHDGVAYDPADSKEKVIVDIPKERAKVLIKKGAALPVEGEEEKEEEAPPIPPSQPNRAAAPPAQRATAPAAAPPAGGGAK